MPDGDLVPPGDEGAAELADLGGTVVVLEVGAEPGDELERDSGRIRTVVGANSRVGGG